MAAGAASILEKYGGAGLGGSTAEVHASIVANRPSFSVASLNKLDASASAQAKKALLQDDASALASAITAILVEEKSRQYLLTYFYDMLRDDASTYSVFEDALKNVNTFHGSLLKTLQGSKDQYTADKAAWLLTAVIGNIPTAFTDREAQEVTTVLQRQDSPCSVYGAMDALVNLLKADAFRKMVWKTQGVSERIMNVSPKTAAPALLYKCTFALWMLSFEPEGSVFFDEQAVIEKIRETLVYSRVEKVVRLSLTVLRNFISHKSFAEQVVERGLLEPVQALEYEKWRDAELYDDIRDMTSQIATKVQEMSSFDRYERELKEGKLKWGFIHSSKFWSENVLKFEQNDFRALKMLAALLDSTDPTTLAVACHDLGDFVAMHPFGKKQISKLGVKERVMSLMSSTSPEHRDVRREALLCCQKIMLNKWQEVEGVAN